MGRLRWYQREEILERDNCQCQICKSNYLLEIHHIRHWSKGGDNRPENLITLCRSCHTAVHTLFESIIPSGRNPVIYKTEIIAKSSKIQSDMYARK